MYWGVKIYVYLYLCASTWPRQNRRFPIYSMPRDLGIRTCLPWRLFNISSTYVVCHVMKIHHKLLLYIDDLSPVQWWPMFQKFPAVSCCWCCSLTVNPWPQAQGIVHWLVVSIYCLFMIVFPRKMTVQEITRDTLYIYVQPWKSHRRPLFSLHHDHNFCHQVIFVPKLKSNETTRVVTS